MTSTEAPRPFPVLGWSDLEVGTTFRTRGRTITESDVTAFAGLTGDYSQIHVNRGFAAESVFGRPVAHGLLVLSYAHGLMLGTGVFEGEALAFLGLDDWRFVRPVFFGDTIYVDFKVGQRRVTSMNSLRGIVRLDVDVVNGNDQTVQLGHKSLMFSVPPGPVDHG